MIFFLHDHKVPIYISPSLHGVCWDGTASGRAASSRSTVFCWSHTIRVVQKHRKSTGLQKTAHCQRWKRYYLLIPVCS